MQPKRIVLATFGSLGDVHPYIAIGRALQRSGHRPVLATTDRYRRDVEHAGVEFAAIRPSEAQIGDLQQVMRKLFDPVRGTEYLIKDLIAPYLRETYGDLMRASEGADLIVTHPLAYAARLAAEKRGLPWVSSVLSPMSLMSCIEPPLFAPAPWMRALRRLGLGPYRAFFALIKRRCAGWEEPLRALRAELGLAPMRGLALFEEQFSPMLNLAMFPRVLAEPQADWPQNTVVCGFARHDGMVPDAAIERELDAFFAAGEPPIVFTLGSSVTMNPGEFFEHAAAAARRLGRRAILIGATLDETRPVSGADAMIRRYAYLPYSIVFPRAAAIVHQGGIGTLAQSLASGRPQLVVPVAFDQPDNAERMVRAGCARSLAFRRASADALAKELAPLLREPGYARSAGRIASEAQRDGAARAAEELVRVAAP